jgi:hypothetical protein
MSRRAISRCYGARRTWQVRVGTPTNPTDSPRAAFAAPRRCGLRFAWERMAAPGERTERQSCPCLYSDDAPICRADLKYLHIPPRSHLARYCRRPGYRECSLYRTWLETLGKAPDRSNGNGNGHGNGHGVVPSADGGTRLAPRIEDAGRTARKEDLMLAVLRRLLSDERAQDPVEYGVGLGMVAAGVFVVTLWTFASGIIAAT